MRVPGAAGLSEFRMRTGMPRSTAGLMVAGMQDLGPEVGELGRLVEADLRDDARARDHARVDRHHAVHVRPDLDLLRAQGRADDRRRPVAAAAAEGGGHALARAADEAGQDGHRARRRRGAGPSAPPPPRVSSMRGVARPKVSSVTMTPRASTRLRRRCRPRRGRRPRSRTTAARRCRRWRRACARSARPGGRRRCRGRAARATVASRWARRRSWAGPRGTRSRIAPLVPVSRISKTTSS